MELFRECIDKLHNEVTQLKEGVHKLKYTAAVLQDLLDAVNKSLDDLQLSDEDGAKLCCIVENAESKEEKENCLFVCAELAKKEENRDVLASNGALKAAFKLLDTTDCDVLLQGIRVIGNTCIDCEKGRNEVLTSGNLPSLIQKLELSSTDSIPQKLPVTLYGCLANITNDHEKLQKEVITLNGIEACVKFLKENTCSKVNASVMPINALSVLLAQEEGRKRLAECQGYQTLLSFISFSEDTAVVQGVLGLIGDFLEEDDFCDAMCEAGLASTLVDFIEKHKCFTQEETTEELFKLSADTIVLLTSGEKSFNQLKDDKSLLKKFGEWFNSLNKHIQTSAGLAICNYARNEELCIALVKDGIHEILIAFIGSCMANLQDSSNQLHAVCSAVKNLAIPASNKTVLGSTPLPMFAVELVLKAPSPVQFKALAILRLLVQDHSHLAVTLCENMDFLCQIGVLSKLEFPVGLGAEAQRTIAALVKNSKSVESRAAIVKSGGVDVLCKLLKAEYIIMQNEAIIALITILQCTSEYVDVILKSECVEISKKLLASTSTEQEVLFNILALLTILHESELGKECIEASDIEPLIEALTQHSQHMVRSRASDLLAFLKR